MSHSQKIRKKALAIMLSVSMAMSVFSGIGLLKSYAAPDTDNSTRGVTRQADPSTMDTYRDMLNLEDNTRYAGRLWSDKTVFAKGQEYTGDAATNDKGRKFNGTTLTLNEELDGTGDPQKIDLDEDFMHVYSVLGSSEEIRESVRAPIDLVILLDMSGSMATDVVDASPHNDGDNDEGLRVEHSRIQQTLNSINQAIDYLMNMNDENRVAVIGYGGTATNLLDLDHYTTDKKESINGKETGVYLTAENFTSYYYNGSEEGVKISNTGSGAYTVHVDATGETKGKVTKYVRNDYHSSKRVRNAPTLIGFHTNMQAGIYQGFNELLKNYNSADDVTYKYT